MSSRKRPFPSIALGQDEIGQPAAPGEGDALVAGAVPVTNEIEKDRGFGEGPVGAEVLLGLPDMGRTDGSRDLVPARVSGFWVRMPDGGFEERRFEDVRREGARERNGFVLAGRETGNGEKDQRN